MNLKPAHPAPSAGLLSAGFRCLAASITVLVITSFHLNSYGQAPGSVDSGYNPVLVGSSVLATAAQPDGKTIIAGVFTSVLGVARNNIARINADGTLDMGFNPNANSDVHCIVVQADGMILLGGAFTSVGGTVRNRIARVDATGTLDSTFNPNANFLVYSLAAQADGKVLLAGAFTSVGGTSRNYIARVDAAGTLDAGFNPSANNNVYSMAVQANGDILLGGIFTSVGGTVRNSIARVDAAGVLDAGFNPNANNGVNDMTVQADGRILLGGPFTSVGGTTRNHLARVDAAGVLDGSFDPNVNGDVRSVAVQADGRILLGGLFTSVGGTTRNRTARVDAVGVLDAGFNPNANSDVYSVAVQADGRILLGGLFTTVDGTARNLFARLVNDPATQTLSAPDATQITWVRGGSAPEVSQVTFELSTDSGATWPPLGGGTRIGTTANWQLTGLSLPAAGQLRARGRTTNGHHNGGSGLLEQVTTYSSGAAPTVTSPTSTDVTATSATLGGNVTGDGGAAITARGVVFSPTATNNDPALGGSGVGSATAAGTTGIFATGVTGLAAGTAYTFKAYATNSMGTTYSSAATFSTDVDTDGDGIGDSTDTDDDNDGVVDTGDNAPFTVNPNQADADGDMIGDVIDPAEPGDGNVDSLNAVVVNNYILSSAVQPDGKTIIAGSFSSVLGQPRSNIARINTDGTIDPGFNPDANGSVYSVAVQADGKTIIAGSFSSVLGQPRSNIARLNANGTLDAGFNPNANSTVNSVALQADGRILLGGYFTSVGGIARNRIARVDAAGVLDAGFNPNADSLVRSVAVQADGRILLGGVFTNVGGIARGGIARVDAAGVLDAGFNPNTNGDVYSVTAQADGRILLGGVFTSVGGATRNRIARVNAAGVLDAGFNPNANNGVYSMAVQADGKILLGGIFTSVGGTTRNRIARLDAAGVLDAGFNPDANSGVYSVAAQADGRILLGGEFTSMGGIERNRFARLLNAPATQTLSAPDATQITWIRSGSSPEVSLVIFEQSTDSGATWIPLGGGTRIGSSPDWNLTGLSLPASGQIRALARTSGGYGNGTSSLLKAAASFSLPPTVTAINPTIGSTAGGTNVTITGTDFTGATAVTIGGSAATGVTVLNATTITATTPAGVAGTASVLVTTSGGTNTANMLYTYRAPGTLDLLNPVIVGGYVHATAVQPNGQTIIAGNFSSVNGVPRSNVARLNAGGGLDMGFDPKANGVVHSVVVQPNGMILLGGAFSTLQPNGAPAPSTRWCIARVNENGTLNEAFNVRTSVRGTVHSIALQPNGMILIGGLFTSIQGTGEMTQTPRNKIARLEATGALDMTFDPKANNTVLSIAVQPNGMILLGGSFTTLQPNGAPSPTARQYIARVNVSGVLDATFDPKANSDVSSVAVQADLSILVGGAFTTLQPNGAVSPTMRANIARLNTTGGLDLAFDPKANGDVRSIAIQSDGMILLGGSFTTLQPNGAPAATARQYVARINASGSLDAGFDPKANGEVHSVALQADGAILVGGSFTALHPSGDVAPTARTFLAQLINAPAAQSLSAMDAMHVQWQRGGASPEVSQVTFELSTDSGMSWTPLGNGARVGTTANWQLAGLGLPASGHLRAQGRSLGGRGNASAGLIESVTAYSLASLPAMKLEQPPGTDLADGTATVAYGQVVVGSTADLVFTIKNTGSADLTLGGTPKVAVGGTDAALFTVTSTPASPVVPGGSTTFTLRFAPVTTGAKTASLSIINNDGSKNPFDVTITGTGAVLTPTFNSATDIGVTSDGFSTTGIAMGPITLNFAPAPGTNLRLVNNTSLGFINGTFSNLAQGQAVQLIFGGITYNFVANYFGGTGNDLVLQWAGTRVFDWGYNFHGELGNNSTTNSPVPVAMYTDDVLSGKTVIAVAGGHYHSLALYSDGSVAAWGDNNFGQLGNNSATDSSVPVAVITTGVLAGKTVIAVAAGERHSLALCSDGSVAAWGGNNEGQLGDGTTNPSPVPVAVNTEPGSALHGRTVIALAAGEEYSLALCSDGSVAAWGGNVDSQLGDGTTNPSLIPVAVNTEPGSALHGKTVIALAAGDSHSMALCSDGSVATWGYNGNGQLGSNSMDSSNVPVAVTTAGVLSGKTVIAVAAGGAHSLALCSDGRVAAWGYNGRGQLGNNSTTDSRVPVLVTISEGDLWGKTVIAVAAGRVHSLALCSDGSVAAWGYNSTGQLGNNSFTDSRVPVAGSTTPLPAEARFIAGAAGGYHSIGLVASPPYPTVTTLAATDLTTTGATLHGTVNANNNDSTMSFEYGLTNAYGSSVAAAPTPVTSSSTTPVSAVLAGLMPVTTYHFRVKGINAAGTSYGPDMTFTTLGLPEIAMEHSAVDIPDGGSKAFDAVMVGSSKDLVFTLKNTGSASLTLNGTPKVILGGIDAALFTIVAQPSSPVASAGQTSFTVRFTPTSAGAKTASLSIANNDSSENPFDINLTGSGITTLPATYTTGMEVPLMTNGFTATGNTVNLTLNHAPVAGTSLMVVNNTGLSFINGTFANLTQGQLVEFTFNGARYRFVANYFGGNGNDLVLQWANTRARAWGANNYGQVGDGTTDERQDPAAVQSAGVLAGKTVISIAAGDIHSLALCSDGTLAAWGNLPAHESYGYGSLPVAVHQTGALTGKTVIAIAAGAVHNLALCSDGTVAAWGNNEFGQFGNGSSSKTPNLVPVAVDTSGVLAGKTVVAIAAGYLSNLALCSDGTLATWGYISHAPVSVGNSGALAGRMVTAIATGDGYSLVLCSDGKLATWGYDSLVPELVSTAGSAIDGKSVVAITCGGEHNLVLCSDGTLAAWGSNGGGQLGNGTTNPSSMPVAVDQTGVLAGKTIIAFTAGGNHSQALCSDGTLVAWGGNGNGQLGNSTTVESYLPVAVSTASLLTGEHFVAGARDQGGWINGENHSIGLVASPPDPVAITLAATSVTTTGATLNGSVNAAGGSAVVSFDYGITNTYGTQAAGTPTPVTGSTTTPVMAAIIGLTPATTYHFRVNGGPGSGADLTFTTLAPEREIAVEQPAGNDLVDGNATVAFGAVNVSGAPLIKTFTIRNIGATDLTGLVISKNGTHSADFTVSALGATTLAGGTNTTFTVSFDPSAAGARTAAIHIASNDANENPFDITLTGTGRTATPGKLAFGNGLILVNEETGTLDVPVVRMGGSEGAVTVKVSSANGTAAAPGDFTALNSYLVNFGDGETNKTVPLVIQMDALNEPSETLTLTLSGATGGATLGAPASTTIRIVDFNDVQPPTVAITTPAANASVPEGAVNVTGTAADTNRVERVQVSVNGGLFTDAVTTVAATGLTATFTAPLTQLMAGSNTVTARSLDSRGNVSTVQSRTFTYAVMSNLVVTVNPPGSGQIRSPQGPYPQTVSREIGKTYFLQTKPNAGFVFNGWTANNTAGTGITPESAEYSLLYFTHQPGLVLTANFIPNPFVPAVIGSFNGLVTPSTNVPAPDGTAPGVDTVGMLQNVVVAGTGAFTGKLLMDGLSLPVAGTFDNTGTARFGINSARVLNLTRTGKPNLDVRLQLDMTGTTGKITGSVQQIYRDEVIANSTIDADRAHYSATAKVPETLAGTTTKPYTLTFPAKAQQPSGLDAAYYPQGDGYATMTVNVNGTVTLSGRLADDTSITASAPLSKNQQWPVFAQLYGLKGCLAGMATLENTATVTGMDLQWIRPYQNVQWYPNGWTDGILVDLAGADYVVPPAVPATSVFPGLQAISPNATLTLSHGLLSAPIIQNLRIIPSNTVIIVGPGYNATLSIVKATGLISGNFIHTDGRRPLFRAVILQKGPYQGARGYFLTETPKILGYKGESGSVSILAK